jgi:hypothetical protein
MKKREYIQKSINSKNLNAPIDMMIGVRFCFLVLSSW